MVRKSDHFYLILGVMFYAGWILVGMVAAVLGVAMPNVVRSRTISSQADSQERYSAGITLLSTNGPVRAASCNSGAPKLVRGSGGILMSSRSDVVMLQARRSAVLSDARAAARRRMASSSVFLLALVVVGIMVFSGTLAGAWLLVPGIALVVMVAASVRASSASNVRLAELEERIAAAKRREAESVEVILARRLAERRTRARAVQVPTQVETEDFETEAVKVEAGWTPMPVPQPLYALKPMEHRRNVDISEVAAQFEYRDEARQVYRPQQLHGIVDGMTSEEAAEQTPVHLDVNTAIDRRRAANS